MIKYFLSRLDLVIGQEISFWAGGQYVYDSEKDLILDIIKEIQIHYTYMEVCKDDFIIRSEECDAGLRVLEVIPYEQWLPKLQRLMNLL